MPPPQGRPEFRPDAEDAPDPPSGGLEFSFEAPPFREKARSVVFDRDRGMVQFRDCHMRGRFIAFRTDLEATFGLDEILAVYQFTAVHTRIASGKKGQAPGPPRLFSGILDSPGPGASPYFPRP